MCPACVCDIICFFKIVKTFLRAFLLLLFYYLSGVLLSLGINSHKVYSLFLVETLVPLYSRLITVTKSSQQLPSFRAQICPLCANLCLSFPAEALLFGPAAGILLHFYEEFEAYALPHLTSKEICPPPLRAWMAVSLKLAFICSSAVP